MAASLTAHMLNDSFVFQTWSHYGGNAWKSFLELSNSSPCFRLFSLYGQYETSESCLGRSTRPCGENVSLSIT